MEPKRVLVLVLWALGGPRLALAMVPFVRSPPASLAAIPASLDHCVPVGECQECPADQLNTEACRPHGNRRLVRCPLDDDRASQVQANTLFTPRTQQLLTVRKPRQEDDDLAPGQAGHGSELDEVPPALLDDDQSVPGLMYPSWEPCTRVVATERADFFEFVLCNFVFALVSLTFYLVRHRKIATRQYLRLASRIGLRLPPSITGDRSSLQDSHS